MKLIPILFSTPMVQAIIEDRKTITRRIMKPQISPCDHKLYVEAEWKDSPTEWTQRDGYVYCGFCGNGVSGTNGYNGIKMKCQVGDVLCVREKWKLTNAGIGYPYDYFACNETFNHPEYEKWKPGIHMPKKACRLFLEVVSVRPERLQDITEEDAKAEGIFVMESCGENGYYNNKQGGSSETAKKSFQILWQSINGKENWKSNPWVWRIEYKKINRPENF